MLYTVRPLERIYATPVYPGKPNTKDRNNKTKEEVEEEYREVLLSHGRIVTRRNGDNYVVERINSTDMKDYLNTEYSPGSDYKN